MSAIRSRRKNRIPVGLEEYEVRIVAKVPNKVPAYGLCDDKNKILYIEAGQHSSALLITFLHEFFHAALHQMGYVGHSNNEVLVQDLAVSTARLMKSFPRLAREFVPRKRKALAKSHR